MNAYHEKPAHLVAGKHGRVVVLGVADETLVRRFEVHRVSWEVR